MALPARVATRVVHALLLAMVALCVGDGVLAQQVAPCTFNSMCTCKLGGSAGFSGPSMPAIHLTTPRTLEFVKDISCVGVPFAKMPELQGGGWQVAHMDVVSSGLEALEGEALGAAQVESLRLMSNRIQLVGERAFASMTDALTSLDLSYNELDHVPFDALRPLKKLDWLNLHSNHIASLESGGEGASDADWGHMRESLTNLFIGENDLVELPSAHGDVSNGLNGHNGNGPNGKNGFFNGNGNGGRNGMRNGNGLSNGNSVNGNGMNGGDANGAGLSGGGGASLADCRRLTWLNVDANKLSTLEGGALPSSLHTLSAAQNHLSRFPAEALDGLRELTWLTLRGNYMETLPDFTFKHKKRLEKLDLGENALQSLPPSMFNNSMTVRDLNLDCNYLTHLPAQAFRGLNAGRIFLSMNRLNATDDRAFVGLGHTLEYLDLEHNELRSIPRSLSQLKRLRYLYIPSNRITDIAEDAFESFSATLRALSLSSNQLSRIPREALRDCRKLSHLNVGYNQIYEVEEEDFARWGGSLDTLLLRNNRIARLDAHVFRHTVNLRELSLSFNKLSEVDPEAFTDVASKLQSLEISFGLYREDFPEDFLKPLTSLQWLALDNNNFRTVSPTALYTFGELQYLNLEANRIGSLTADVFHPNVHNMLRDVRLSFNHLVEIESETFSGLRSLQTVVLTGNRVRTLRTNAFRGLPSLLTLVISENRLASLAPRCFTELPNLVKLDLQSNEMKDFALSVFLNVTSPYMPLTLNLSRNQISALYPGDTGGPIYVKAVDLSHNRVPEVPVNFLQSFAESLRRLHLGYNRISRLDPSAFGPLELLEVLTMEHNGITTLRKKAFEGLHVLQMLDLSHNHIEQLQVEQFSDMRHLRIVDLSHNHIRSVSRDAFQGTRLERLDLSHNEFVVMPNAALGEVGQTLRYLDMSRNQIEHLDSTMFSNTPYLLGLSLSQNKLTILPDNVFTGLGNLLRLDISNNLLRANFKELFHYVQRLRHLNMAETGQHACPPLPLPNLVTLNLSSNSIQEVSPGAVEGLERLRSLDLSSNRLQAAPQDAWAHIPLLKTLDISRNPIKTITKESFVGIHRLQTLSVVDLKQLERFDADSLSRLRLLSTLNIQTWPRIEKYRFRLGGVLSSVPSLRKLSVRVLESALTDQLLNAFSPKLRHLEITGRTLRSVAADALEGVEANYELALRISGTQISSLPAGLFARLHRVPHLSLDLRDNKFTTLSPGTIYPNGSSWESVGTKLISGGMVLKGNPWQCDCGLVWLGHWLRRWLRETLQIHTTVLEGAQQMQALAREATCSDPRTGQQTPLVDLYPEDLSCHASALSRGGSQRLSGAVSHTHLAALLALCWGCWWRWSLW